MEISKQRLEDALTEAKQNCSVKFGKDVEEIYNRNNSNGELFFFNYIK